MRFLRYFITSLAFLCLLILLTISGSSQARVAVDRRAPGPPPNHDESHEFRTSIKYNSIPDSEVRNDDNLEEYSPSLDEEELNFRQCVDLESDEDAYNQCIKDLYTGLNDNADVSGPYFMLLMGIESIID